MRISQYLLFCFLLFLISTFGCSTGGTLTTPQPDDSSLSETSKVTGILPIGVSDYFTDGSPASGMGTLGLFHLHLDPHNLTGELCNIRQGMLPDVLEVVDITNFLQLAPCTDCVKLQSVSLDDDGNLVASIGIKHPFEEGDPFKPITGKNRGDLHVFNIEGIVVSNNPATSFPAVGRSAANFRLLNASGYTGYLDPVLENIYPTDATIHPCILHFDDYSQGNFDPNNPMGFSSVTDPHPSGNLVMPMGSDYDFKDYIFDLPDEPMDFIFAIGCSYAVSAASKAERFNPEFRVPQHLKKAASEVWVDIVENDLAGEDTESSAVLQINVVDISHGIPVGDALNEMLGDSSVSGVSVEVPGVTAGAINFSIDPISGTGHDPEDPLVFEGEITNAAGADEGTYLGLVKITDSYPPGLNESPLLDGMDGIERVDPIVNPLEGLFAIPEFATYQVFSIDVELGASIEIITPNGGETLWMAMEHEILWDPAVPGITDVRIEWSTDDFVSDIRTIVESTPNDGSYLWKPVPVEESTSAKIRITNVAGSESDTSDDYFSIALPIWLDFEPKVLFDDSTVTWGWASPYEPERNYISPALLQTTTGVIYIGFYGVNYGEISADCFVRSSNGTSWYGSGNMFGTGGGPHAVNFRKDHCKVAPSHQGYGWMRTRQGTGHTTDIARGNGGPGYYTFQGVTYSWDVPKYPELATDEAGYIFTFGDNNTAGIWWNKSVQPGLYANGAAGQLTSPSQLVADSIISKARSWARQGEGLSLIYFTNGGQIKLAETTDAPTNETWDTEEIVWSITDDYESVHTPALHTDSQGRLFAAWVAEKSGGETDILASMRPAAGEPWSTPSVVTTASNDLTDVAISTSSQTLPTTTTEDVAVVSWNNGDEVFTAISPLDLAAFLPIQQVSDSGDVARSQDSMCVDRSYGYQFDVIFTYSSSESDWTIAANNAVFETP